MNLTQEKVAALVEQGVISGEEGETLLALQRQQQQQIQQPPAGQQNTVPVSLTPKYGTINPNTGRLWDERSVRYQEQIDALLADDSGPEQKPEQQKTQQPVEKTLTETERVLKAIENTKSQIKAQLAAGTISQSEADREIAALSAGQTQILLESIKNPQSEPQSKPVSQKPLSEMTYSERIQAQIDLMD
jgi:hypothetical protein